MPGTVRIIQNCVRPLLLPPSGTRWAVLAILLTVMILPVRPANGWTDLAEAPGESSPAPAKQDLDATVEQLARRLQSLEQRNAVLSSQNEDLIKRLESVTGRYEELNQRLRKIEPGAEATAPAASPLPSTPNASPFADLPETLDMGRGSEVSPSAGSGFAPGGTAEENDASWTTTPLQEAQSAARFLVGSHDDESGMYVLVRPHDAQRTPFELQFDLFTQVRFTNFGKSQDSWVDSSGQRMPIRNFDSVEVTRNFIQFSGFGLDPKLQYTAIIFSSTALNDTVYMGWVNYQFNRAFDLRVGNWLVPGTREWYESFRYTMGADRLMATTFFRPNISPGIWLQGEPIDNLYYVAMVANSLNRFTQGVVNRFGSSRAFGGTIRWEPLGDFGLGPSDIENHDSPRLRLGTSGAISREANQGFDPALNNPEDTIVRLSDGTPLFRTGALGPGVVLESTHVNLWALDAALKYRGVGISGEYFLRRLDNFQITSGRSPYRSLFDHGGLLQLSYFFIPTKFETFARTSFVNGPFGDGNEYGGGANWYPRGTRDWRLTFEVLRINRSPAQNFLTGYRAGESGTLFQLQWLTDF